MSTMRIPFTSRTAAQSQPSAPNVVISRAIAYGLALGTGILGGYFWSPVASAWFLPLIAAGLSIGWLRPLGKVDLYLVAAAGAGLGSAITTYLDQLDQPNAFVALLPIVAVIFGGIFTLPFAMALAIGAFLGRKLR